MDTSTALPLEGIPDKNTGSKGQKPTKILPSPRLVVTKQLDALRAFAVAAEAKEGPVSNEEAGKIIGMSGNTVVVSNAFLTEVGLLIRKESGFEPSAVVRAYQKAYEWNSETAGCKLAPAFEDKWFSKILIPRLKMRPYPKREAVQVLAEAANASKDYESNVYMLLEFMAAAGLLALDGDTVRVGDVSNDAVEKVALAPEKTQEVQQPVLEGDICYLNKDRSRFVRVVAPLDITRSEIERLKAWLSLMYFVDDEASHGPGSPT